MSTAAKMIEFCRWLSRPKLLLYALPYLIIILTVGTLAQADMGLFAAHQRYFASWIFWWGPLPLPGMYAVLGLITLSLSIKFLVSSPWSREKLGTTLTHLGVLILLYGGLATALTQEEGFIVIAEGQSAQAISDYHDRVLKITKEGEVVEQIPFGQLREGRPLSALPFQLTPKTICRNCSADLIETQGSIARHGMAEKITLSPAALEKEDELNLSGMMFEASGTGQTDGLYATLEDVPMIPQFEIEGAAYGIQMGRRITPLPFMLTLQDFARDDYPGTNEARSYHSDIIVQDGDVEWPVRIEMNTPLRYRGYTFYQSSFVQNPDGSEKTVLSAVRNKGWLFPYAASIVIFAGLCVHLFQRLTRKAG